MFDFISLNVAAMEGSALMWLHPQHAPIVVGTRHASRLIDSCGQTLHR